MTRELRHEVSWADCSNGRFGPCPERHRPTLPPSDAPTLAETVRTIVLLDVQHLLEGLTA